MGNLALFANLIASLSSSNVSFSEVSSQWMEEDIAIVQENDIDSWDDYYEYVIEKSSSKGDGDGSQSEAIVDVPAHLAEAYSDYNWIIDEDNSVLTSDVSAAIPIEMGGNGLFPRSDIQAAIDVAGVRDKTDYGGCGPIALMGIIDYFSRYLGYDEFIEDPTDSEERIALAAEVLSRLRRSMYGDAYNTFVSPDALQSCFRLISDDRGLYNIHPSITYTPFGGIGDAIRWELKNSIDKGMPVTLYAGLFSGDGEFAKHYTNVYGYETWIGVSKSDKSDKIEKMFLKARLNWGRSQEYYCDAVILNDAQAGIMRYEIKYENEISFGASDFAQEFVNDSGGGQYFFDRKLTDVYLDFCKKTVSCERLRASYIENQYLVLSPKRAGAGEAYVDIFFERAVQFWSLDISMWGGLEDAAHETFEVQYFCGDDWKHHLWIDLSELSTIKEYPDHFRFLFPKKAQAIKFIAISENPSGSRNRGRVVLDNFNVSYDDVDIWD